MKRSLPLLSLTLLLAGCQTAYYAAMEKAGVPKRDIMVDRVTAARDSQSEAKEEFKDALTLFSEVVKVEGGKLEAKYKKLNKAYERSASKAEEVRNRVDKVESVANALFKEWRTEMKAYSNAELRKASKQQYDETHDKYTAMMKSMHHAANQMNPVLSAFYDQVLFLKHNLNARAISSIRSEVKQVEQDVARLISEMEASIAEADAFIRELGGS